MIDSKIIDGKDIAHNLRKNLTDVISQYHGKYGFTPGLAVVIVGDNSASKIYVANKQKMAQQSGIYSLKHELPYNTSQKKLLSIIDELNNNPRIHGILVQLPLPEHIDAMQVIDRIKPAKDVDGFTTTNVGLLNIGNRDAMVPCTPLGCLLMLQQRLKDLSGKNAVIIGRSNIVGKPAAALLLQQNCTVSIVHSRTQNPQSICRKADILIAAIGRAHHINKDWVKDGATIIDVGINRIPGENGRHKIVGDVAFDDVYDKVEGITPVPGGVGPMTIACLLRNTLYSACRLAKLPLPISV